ncbi:hypothetical protein G7Z17_g1271 [Cylindrodendrum hubeiense]|uniref:Uncharacterized protein n=1 Tax=Cylindrodendrum hubeiense TaxID=595255 RepID=A0A9P5HL96_9HYPO|nr:hypothetical protein G7Z17_g1271 [Cylindrodendrum hubeiense]
MATKSTLHGKGIFFVNSKISRPDVLDLSTFMRWYDDDHIPEIIETSGIRSARRFVDIDPEVDMPYLAMYPMNDLGFTESQEFRSIRVTSDILPENSSIYDLVDINARCDNLIIVHDKTMQGKGTIKSLVVINFEPKESVSPEDADRWFREKVGNLSPLYELLDMEPKSNPVSNSETALCRDGPVYWLPSYHRLQISKCEVQRTIASAQRP